MCVAGVCMNTGCAVLTVHAQIRRVEDAVLAWWQARGARPPPSHIAEQYLAGKQDASH